MLSSNGPRFAVLVQGMLLFNGPTFASTIMKVKYENSLRFKMLKRMQGLPVNVFLRRDFKDLGEYRQLSRAFRTLISEQKLVRIGTGVYARARVSSLSGESIPIESFVALSREVLDRLQVKWQPRKAELDYNAGRSTQVPVRRGVMISGRFNRKIAWKGWRLEYKFQRAGSS